MTELVEGEGPALLFHLLPRLLLEGGGGGADLGDDAEGVLLHVFHGLTHGAVFVLSLAVAVKVPEGVAEVAVLVVKEDKIDGVVSAGLGFLHGDAPDAFIVHFFLG